MDRRGFLMGALAGGLVLAGGDGGALAAGPRLSPRRARVYRRLVVALQAAPGSPWRHRDAAGATRSFARWYAGQLPATRAHADAVLDALGAAGPVTYRTLAARGSGDPQGAALTAAAIGLGAIPCDPLLAPGERPLATGPRIP
jgi:hypothetical protein